MTFVLHQCLTVSSFLGSSGFGLGLRMRSSCLSFVDPFAAVVADRHPCAISGAGAVRVAVEDVEAGHDVSAHHAVHHNTLTQLILNAHLSDAGCLDCLSHYIATSLGCAPGRGL